MNVLLCCLPFIRLRRPPRPRLRQPLAEPELRDTDPPLPGCGWFDSSWECCRAWPSPSAATTRRCRTTYRSRG
jgi:hypothetical protein